MKAVNGNGGILIVVFMTPVTSILMMHEEVKKLDGWKRAGDTRMTSTGASGRRGLCTGFDVLEGYK